MKGNANKHYSGYHTPLKRSSNPSLANVIVASYSRLSLSLRLGLHRLMKHPALSCPTPFSRLRQELPTQKEDLFLLLVLQGLNATRRVSFNVNNLFLVQRATFTRLIVNGTSINGPITVAKASLEARPSTETVTAIASSKLLQAAVKASEGGG